MNYFIVTTKNGLGEKVPLRGTCWAYSLDRAQQFPTREAAQAALAKAKPFTKFKAWKDAQIEEITA